MKTALLLFIGVSALAQIPINITITGAGNYTGTCTATTSINCTIAPVTPPPPVPQVIYSDDVCTDVDGAIAASYALALQNGGSMNILGMLAGTSVDYGPGYFQLLMTYAGLGTSIPIGSWAANDLEMTDNYCNSAMTGYQSPILHRSNFASTNVVARTALHNASLSRGPIYWVETGYGEVLQSFLQSPGDGIDSRTGAQMATALGMVLVAEAGRFPTSAGSPNGWEWNLGAGSNTPTWYNYVIANWPGQIVWLGTEAGDVLPSGSGWPSLPTSSPAKRTASAWTGSHTLPRGSWGSSAYLYLMHPALWTDTLGSIVIPSASTPTIPASNSWSGTVSQSYVEPASGTLSVDGPVNGATATTGTSITTTVVPTASTDIAVCGGATAGSTSVGSGYTGVSLNVAGSTEYKLLSSSGSQNCSFSYSTSGTSSALGATYSGTSISVVQHSGSPNYCSQDSASGSATSTTCTWTQAPAVGDSVHCLVFAFSAGSMFVSSGTNSSIFRINGPQYYGSGNAIYMQWDDAVITQAGMSTLTVTNSASSASYMGINCLETAGETSTLGASAALAQALNTAIQY